MHLEHFHFSVFFTSKIVLSTKSSTCDAFLHVTHLQNTQSFHCLCAKARRAFSVFCLFHNSAGKIVILTKKLYLRNFLEMSHLYKPPRVFIVFTLKLCLFHWMAQRFLKKFAFMQNPSKVNCVEVTFFKQDGLEILKKYFTTRGRSMSSCPITPCPYPLNIYDSLVIDYLFIHFTVNSYLSSTGYLPEQQNSVKLKRATFVVFFHVRFQSSGCHAIDQVNRDDFKDVSIIVNNYHKIPHLQGVKRNKKLRDLINL